VLWRTWQFLVARKTESVIATDHELTVGVSSRDLVRNRRNFFVHIAVSYSKKWRGCVALLNVNASDWRLQLVLTMRPIQGCSGAGTASPHFFDREDASPTPPLFGLKFVQKLVHCCNWLLTEPQCKIISVQQH